MSNNKEGYLNLSKHGRVFVSLSGPSFLCFSDDPQKAICEGRDLETVLSINLASHDIQFDNKSKAKTFALQTGESVVHEFTCVTNSSKNEWTKSIQTTISDLQQAGDSVHSIRASDPNIVTEPNFQYDQAPSLVPRVQRSVDGINEAGARIHHDFQRQQQFISSQEFKAPNEIVAFEVAADRDGRSRSVGRSDSQQRKMLRRSQIFDELPRSQSHDDSKEKLVFQAPESVPRLFSKTLASSMKERRDADKGMGPAVRSASQPRAQVRTATNRPVEKPRPAQINNKKATHSPHSDSKARGNGWAASDRVVSRNDRAHPRTPRDTHSPEPTTLQRHAAVINRGDNTGVQNAFSSGYGVHQEGQGQGDEGNHDIANGRTKGRQREKAEQSRDLDDKRQRSPFRQSFFDQFASPSSPAVPERASPGHHLFAPKGYAVKRAPSPGKTAAEIPSPSARASSPQTARRAPQGQGQARSPSPKTSTIQRVIASNLGLGQDNRSGRGLAQARTSEGAAAALTRAKGNTPTLMRGHNYIESFSHPAPSRLVREDDAASVSSIGQSVASNAQFGDDLDEGPALGELAGVGNARGRSMTRAEEGEFINDAAEVLRLEKWLREVEMSKYSEALRKGGVTKLSVLELMDERELLRAGVAGDDVAVLMRHIGELSSCTSSFVDEALHGQGQIMRVDKLTPAAPKSHASLQLAKMYGAMSPKVLCLHMLRAFDDGDVDSFEVAWTVMLSRLRSKPLETSANLPTETDDLNGWSSDSSWINLLRFQATLHFAVYPFTQGFSSERRAASMKRFRSTLDAIHRAANVPTLTNSKEFAFYSGIVFVPDPASNPVYASILKVEWTESLRRKLEKFIAAADLQPSPMKESRTDSQQLPLAQPQLQLKSTTPLTFSPQPRTSSVIGASPQGRQFPMATTAISKAISEAIAPHSKPLALAFSPLSFTATAKLGAAKIAGDARTLDASIRSVNEEMVNEGAEAGDGDRSLVEEGLAVPLSLPLHQSIPSQVSATMSEVYADIEPKATLNQQSWDARSDTSPTSHSVHSSKAKPSPRSLASFLATTSTLSVPSSSANAASANASDLSAPPNNEALVAEGVATVIGSVEVSSSPSSDSAGVPVLGRGQGIDNDVVMATACPMPLKNEPVLVPVSVTLQTVADSQERIRIPVAEGLSLSTSEDVGSTAPPAIMTIHLQPSSSSIPPSSSDCPPRPPPPPPPPPRPPSSEPVVPPSSPPPPPETRRSQLSMQLLIEINNRNVKLKAPPPPPPPPPPSPSAYPSSQDPPRMSSNLLAAISQARPNLRSVRGDPNQGPRVRSPPGGMPLGVPDLAASIAAARKGLHPTRHSPASAPTHAPAAPYLSPSISSALSPPLSSSTTLPTPSPSTSSATSSEPSTSTSLAPLSALVSSPSLSPSPPSPLPFPAPTSSFPF